MRAVGSDGPPASKVRAIRCLLVLPIAISATDTGCIFGGVSHGDSVGLGVGLGVVPCVGNGVGVTVIPGKGVEIADSPGVGVCVVMGPEVAVG